MKKSFAALLTALVFITGCSTKKEVEYNKPAIYWYQKIIKKISVGDLDKADEYFTSLQSEHIGSPFLAEAMLMLAKAHMENEEYLLAQFYLDEYIKRYATYRKREFAEYLKIKASFLGFKNLYRDQKLLMDTIKDANGYLEKYPDSEFVPLVQTILTKLYMAEFILNKEIVSLYKRRGKPEAAKIYEERLKSSWINDNEILRPESAWYEKMLDW
ncbi:outer membrane protein assembly factor BamD [Nitrosophilus alvini]|uniref:outer membrane protein assembly factor BamD n=1 Tax=Nitrosophilus alvini TaxID=2714855 RepID=UPI00190D105E|nr:outer membrane protein assembly factor BamD [Nitrosophilus alvini]